jgi:U3 small nucleolar RNA-associated protein 11
MASLRNAVPQKTHKERHQPGKRQKLGLLEKHKDYVMRAKDYNKKQATIKKLEQKAAFKNPDEYYFKMVNTRKVVSIPQTNKRISISGKSHTERFIERRTS